MGSDVQAPLPDEKRGCILRRVKVFLGVVFVIRESRIWENVMNLKPQDVVVLLKLCGKAWEARPPYAEIASKLGLSASEVHSSIKRLQTARLIHGKDMGQRPNIRAVEEFLIHGVKYSFPAEHGVLTRGIPTSYAAEPLSRLIKSGNDPLPVWPDKDGTTRGMSLTPLYKTVPQAAKQDAALYELLALMDAIRDGRARERNIAEKELLKRIGKINGQPKS